MFGISKSIVITVALVAFTVSGCYTKLMTPQEFVHTQRYQSKQSFSDNSYSLNYNQSCVTCHSTTELNERAEEMEYYGVRTVHDGMLLSSRSWVESPVAGPTGPILMPVPYWPTPYDPVYPWWVNPATTSPVGDVSRIRDGGATRDGNRERERSTPLPPSTNAQPQAPVGGTTPAPSTPAPAVQSSPSTQSAPAQTNDSGRTRDSNNNTNSSNRNRSDGATRDDSGNRPR